MNQCLLHDDGTGRLQQQVQRHVIAANRERTAIKTHEMSLGGNFIPQLLLELLERGDALLELLLELLALLRRPVDDLPDLGVACPVERPVDERLGLVSCRQSSHALVMTMDVTGRDSAGIFTCVPLGKVMSEHAKLQPGSVNSNLSPAVSRRPEESTAFSSVRRSACWYLSHVRIRVRHSARDTPISVDTAVDPSITIIVKPLSNLSNAFLQ